MTGHGASLPLLVDPPHVPARHRPMGPEGLRQLHHPRLLWELAQAEELLKSRGLWNRIDEVVWADENDPTSPGMQLGAGTLADPSTGLAQVSLPADAIDSIAVLANPYSVEYGRFSSGLVVIETRRSTRSRASECRSDP